MKKSFLAKTAWGRVIVMAAGITLVITFITVAVCFSIFQFFLYQNQIQTVEFNLQPVANGTNFSMEDILYFNDWLLTDNQVSSYLENFKGKERMTYASMEDKGLRTIALATLNRVKEECMASSTQKYMTRPIISPDNVNSLPQFIYLSDESSPHNVQRLLGADFYSYLYNSPNYQWIGLVDDPFFNIGGNNPIIPLARLVYKGYNSDIIGWTYLSISSNVVADYLRSYPPTDDSAPYFPMDGKFYRIGGDHVVGMSPDFTMETDTSQNVLGSDTRAQTIRMAGSSRRTLVSKALEPEG